MCYEQFSHSSLVRTTFPLLRHSWPQIYQMYALNRQGCHLPCKHLSNIGRRRRVTSCFQGDSFKFSIGAQNGLANSNTVFSSPRTYSSDRDFIEILNANQTPQSAALTPKGNSPAGTYKVYQALRNGEPGQILKVLANVEHQDLVASMPDSVFVSAFLRLTPEYFVEPYVGVLLHAHEGRMANKDLNTTSQILGKFFKAMNQILVARRAGGRPFGLVEYRHLLRISASVGDLKTVLGFWQLMKESGVEPDIHCYNSFLHACVWEGAVYGRERFRLRVTPFYYRKRRSSQQKAPHRGFGTAGNSVRKQVYSIILEMRSLNLPLDEDTFIYMLLASARVGSRSGMNQVLKSIWGVDVEVIANAAAPDEDDLPAATPYAESSPLYPTRKLLWAVAHAYGCNSMFEVSLRTVQYISKQYGIEITDDVWAELFGNAFVLSRKRYGKDALPLRLGKIRSDTLFELKHMMQLNGKEYDMNVYHMLATTARGNNRYPQFQEILREAYKLLRRTRRARNHAFSVLENNLGVPLQTQTSSSPPIMASPAVTESLFRKNCSTSHVWRALRKYELLRLLVEQQQCHIEQMAQNVIFSKRRWEGRWEEWSHRLLPKFLAEWKDFLPESYSVTLLTKAGTIEFIGRTTLKDANIRMHKNEPVRWSDCGDFVAEEDEQIQISHDVLWAHIRARLGGLVRLQPFQWFMDKAWNRLPVLIQKVEDMEDEFREGLPARSFDVGATFEEGRNWDRREQHAFYVTMQPLCAPVSL